MGLENDASMSVQLRLLSTASVGDKRGDQHADREGNDLTGQVRT